VNGSKLGIEELILCPEHEILLLERLFNNWEKRKARGDKAQPKAFPIYKDQKLEKKDEVGDEANHPDAG
jgi:hypothetical protein